MISNFQGIYVSCMLVGVEDTNPKTNKMYILCTKSESNGT